MIDHEKRISEKKMNIFCKLVDWNNKEDLKIESLRVFELNCCLGFLSLLNGFLPLHVMFQAHMSTQVGSTTESGVAEDAGCLVPMHFKVLGQRSKVLVNTSAETARKTPWTLHHHLTSCIANMLPFPSHPPCNTSTVSWPRFLTILILIKRGVQKIETLSQVEFF